MYYQSTRDASLTATAAEAVLRGIAPDGGLYVFPADTKFDFDWRGCLEKPPLGMAETILSTLLPGFDDMRELVERSYEGKFSTPELTPLVPVGDLYALELYHGPTAAFKDVALSVLPRLTTAARRITGSTDETVILTATSGDTGTAALTGFQDVPGCRILVFYPDQGVSAIQYRQMVTQEGGNVGVCGVRGNFDDCQRGVKEAFARIDAQGLLAGRGIQLSSANSINIGRLAPQVVYYFLAYASLVKRGAIRVGDTVDYSVPTGNFGDILAGYFAKLLGLPVGRLLCASNANDVLTEFLSTGVYDRRRPFYRTTSPSMDILVSSNLERFLYLISGGDTELVAGYMEQLNTQGRYEIGQVLLSKIRQVLYGGCCNDSQALEVIGRLWREQGYLCDPHTAVGFHVAEAYRRETGSDTPLVVLSTASAYKFPDNVMKALGHPVEGEFEAMDALHALTGAGIPPVLASLRQKPVLHTDVIDAGDIQRYVLEDFIARGGA